jgi:predicted membrane channel-forming protein YqfA (hemolysin III family)
MSETWKLLFTTDFGLMSLGVILFIVGMSFYLSRHLKKLMNQKPGTEGWE